MSDSPASESESTFVCDCEEWMRSACTGEPFYGEHEGKRYCLFHFPSQDKSADFNQALQRKLDIKHFNFQGFWFPGTFSFRCFHFSKDVKFGAAVFSDEADFSDTVFDERASFFSSWFYSRANFAGARFKAWADFRYTGFGGRADFLHTIFDAKTSFNGAFFRGQADFASARFSAEVNFNGANFSGQTFFGNAIFEDYVRFSPDDDLRLHGSENGEPFGHTSLVDFQYIRTEKPDRVFFHTLRMHPNWFVNVDSRKFSFTNVDWHSRLNQEIEYLELRDVSAPHRLIAIASRHLAVNAEENHRYEEASKFRYMAMEAQRLETWCGLVPWRLSWWYWLASGYGERILRAFVVLLGIWFVAGLLYTRVGFARWEPKLASETDVGIARRDDVGAPLKFRRALTYSAAVMTFQKPEPKPATTAAQTVVLLETILGPVQAALLALAIRRKFMR